MTFHVQQFLIKEASKVRGVDKWDFGYLIGRFVGWYWLYSTNLVCLANERFWYLYGWNPYL